MVQNPGKTLCADVCLRRINIPEPVRVEESSSGEPVAVRTPQKQVITAIDGCWRIDDEWWRNEPVSRLYYAIRFVSGQRLVIYQDLINGEWYKQAY
jgi:hypothetical protein